MRVMEVMVFRHTSYLVTIKGWVDYAECGVWKMWNVENAECGKCRVEC